MGNGAWAVEAAASSGVGRARPFEHPAPQPTPDPASVDASGAAWAAAVGAEAARLVGYLGLLACVAGSARQAGAAEVALTDLPGASPRWASALGAAATAVGDEAGVRLSFLDPFDLFDPFGPFDPGSTVAPLGLVAVDVDDAGAVEAAAAVLAGPPAALLPRVVLALRSQSTRYTAGPAALADLRADLRLRPGGSLVRLPGQPWPVERSASSGSEPVYERAYIHQVADHPEAGVVHLPSRRMVGSAGSRSGTVRLRARRR